MAFVADVADVADNLLLILKTLIFTRHPFRHFHIMTGNRSL